MTTRNIYVRPENEPIWNEAEKVFSGESLADVVARALQQAVENKKLAEQGEAIELEVGGRIGGVPRKIKFQGTLIARWPEEGIALSGQREAYIMTKKGKILIHSDFRMDGATYAIYDDVEDLTADDTDFEPEFIARIADALGEEYVEELDV